VTRSEPPKVDFPAPPIDLSHVPGDRGRSLDVTGTLADP
jgi:hypothetical protein